MKLADSLPKISVVIFTYNFEKYLRECIESVLAQTLYPFEIIICDDHSTDDSWKIISEYSKRHPEIIKSYRHKKNMGPAHSGCFGMKKAKGDLVVWLDGDDRWLPKKLELEWKALQKHPDAHIAYSNIYTIDAEGNRNGIWYDGNGPAPPSGDVFIEVFSHYFFPKNSNTYKNALIYHSALKEVGYFDLNLASNWDFDERIRLTSRFRVAYSGEALIEYRLHKRGFSRSEPRGKHFRAMVDIYEKNLPLLINRTQIEITKVKCSIESLLALWQVKLPLSEHMSYYTARNVYERNRKLLEQLPHYDCEILKKELSFRFSRLARRAAIEESKKGTRKRALKYWLESLHYNPKSLDIIPIVQIMFPKWFCDQLKRFYRYLSNFRHNFFEYRYKR